MSAEPLAAAPLDPTTLAEPVWVVSPHPDDEALGCGALLAALGELGRETWALLLTDGGASHLGSPSHPRPRLAARRRQEWLAGLAELGVPAGRTRALDIPDGALGGCDPELIRARVSGAFGSAPPGTVLLPWRRDPHADHRATWGPVQAACAPGVRLLGYSVWLAERGAAADWPPAWEARRWSFEGADFSGPKARAIAAHATQLGAITDDPGGFTLAPGMVERAVRGPERYFEPLDADPGEEPR